MSRARALQSFLGRLRRDRSGLALIEFAFTMPLLLMTGVYGMEVANLALIHLRVSQIALALADNASRVGDTPLTSQQLREIDVNDVLQAARYQGSSIDLTTRGRVIISSLENVARSYTDHPDDPAPVQRLHWQRCIGLMGSAAGDSAYRSAYPTTGTLVTAAGSDPTYANRGVDQAGMGKASALVNAPQGVGVIFVEINYNYKPLMAGWLLGNTQRIHYEASFIVRDNRDFKQLFNPNPAVSDDKKMTCDHYTPDVPT